MPVSLFDILTPETITGRVREVAGPSSLLVNHFGFDPGGANTIQIAHPSWGWDIYDDAREIVRPVARDAPATRIKPQPVGHRDATVFKFFDAIELNADKLHNQRMIGEGPSTYDDAGRRYVDLQIQNLARRFTNTRLALTIGMCRGYVAYARNSSGQMYLTYDSSNSEVFQAVDYGVPAGNFGQGDIDGNGAVITASWDTLTTRIHDHIIDLNARQVQVYGREIQTIICNGYRWSKIVSNTTLGAVHGTANLAYEVYERVNGTDATGKPYKGFRARLNAIPWLDFLVTDEGVVLETAGGGTSYTPAVDNDHIIVLPQVDGETFEMVESGSMEKEDFAKPMTFKQGMQSWYAELPDPARYILYGVDNVLAYAKVPRAILYLKVANF